MLCTLAVRHFVVVDELELDFSGGFSVLTGETGAGKSILIGALDLLLGGRADANVVRSGQSKADLWARFSIAELHEVQAWCKGVDLDTSDDEIILRRSIDASGKSKAWINGQPATLAQLRELGELMIDIHGQHAHQALLKPNAQRELLDRHAHLTGRLAQVQEAYRQWQSLARTLEQASSRAAELAGMRDQLQWKADEISALKLAPGEWERLSEEERRLSHSAELIQSAESARGALTEDDASLLASAEALAKKLRHCLDKDPGLSNAVHALDRAVIELQEACDALQKYLDKTDLDPARLGDVQARVEAIFNVARKLKTRPEALPDLLDETLAALLAAEQSADIAGLEKKIASAKADYDTLAKGLSDERRKACRKLSKEVTQWFSELAMQGMSFEAICEARPQPAGHGLEDVVFMLKSQAQSASYPIHKVASGGELSRISLAIAVVTASATPIATLIFDEVDAGIGGNVAHTVGRLLRTLGDQRQVLCVTHLPQVAARGHHHLQVTKSTAKDGKPVSHLQTLNDSQRIDEIARMLGDEGTKKTSREHAKSLLALV